MRVDQLLIFVMSGFSFWVGWYFHDIYLVYKGRTYDAGWADGAFKALGTDKNT